MSCFNSLMGEVSTILSKIQPRQGFRSEPKAAERQLGLCWEDWLSWQR